MRKAVSAIGVISAAPWQDILDLAYYSGWRKQEILGLTCPTRFSSRVSRSVSNQCNVDVSAAPRSQRFGDPMRRKVGSAVTRTASLTSSCAPEHTDEPGRRDGSLTPGADDFRGGPTCSRSTYARLLAS